MGRFLNADAVRKFVLKRRLVQLPGCDHENVSLFTAELPPQALVGEHGELVRAGAVEMLNVCDVHVRLSFAFPA